MTGLAGAPAFAETSSPATVSPKEVCAQEEQQSSTDSESDSSVPDESDPQATLAKAQVTRDDIADQKKGIGFSGTGFTPDEKATVTVVGTDGTEYAPEKKLTVDEKGEVSGTYFFSVTDGAKVPVGKYSLYLTDLKSEKKSSKVTFEVVSKASDVDDPGNDDTPGNNDDKNCDSATAPADDGDKTESESPSPSPSETGSETPSESNTPSPTETDDKSDDSPVKGVNPGPAKKPTTEAPTPTKTDDEDSDTSKDADDKTSEAPTPTETDDADGSKDAEDNDKSEDTKRKASEDDGSKSDDEKSDDGATDDEKSEDKASESTGPASPGSDEKKAPAAAKQSLFIDPTEISSEDFLDKGIKLGVSGAQPGEKITITVEHAQGKVDRYTMTKEADSEGKATFGVQAKVKAVLGTYNVTAQAESFDEPQGGSFTVLTNGTAVDDGGNGSGSTGSGSGSDSSGSDLPRTGAEMTGLALGVGLLAVGAAAVIITRRRMNATDDPAEF
ncbi:LPXTG cell wall anchor domain-containing protein [Brevibacterium atlanticum]|uniref:LPXTG cell wall anchor domain-containing protein n=1 Tax=Brevibacterium atlanticum TaxID=2697563 RepID=UPI001421ADE1|nr:LPXTG cell wall anchor domain-containing protein [Brevibacterium atlanticum]